MDRYGFTTDHPNCTLELDEDYVDTLPKHAQTIAMSMQYAEAWKMNWKQVLEMPYAEFYEAMMVSKAINYKKPWWTGDVGYQAFIMEKTQHKRLNKPRRKNQ